MQVVLIPEQIWIATVRAFVVDNRTVICRMLADAENAGSLAGVVVPDQDMVPKLLPPCSLVPTTMFEVGITLTMALLLITSHTAEARRKGRELGLESGEARTAHISRCTKGDRKAALSFIRS